MFKSMDTSYCYVQACPRSMSKHNSQSLLVSISLTYEISIDLENDIYVMLKKMFSENNIIHQDRKCHLFSFTSQKFRFLFRFRFQFL